MTTPNGDPVTDHLEQAAAKNIELAHRLTSRNANEAVTAEEAAQHMTYLAGLIRGGAVRALPGRCGAEGMALLVGEAPYCALRAGHAGWHEDEDGCSWGEVDELRDQAKLSQEKERLIIEQRDALLRAARAFLDNPSSGLAVHGLREVVERVEAEK